MKYLDIETWERKEQYKLFHSMDYPHINICANVDITTLLTKVKENKLSFYNSMIYITCKTANSIKEFRYRIRGEKVVIHDSVHPSFTYLKNKTDEVFNFCIIEYNPNFLEFDKAIKDKINETDKVDLSDEEGKDDMLFISSIPWITFTSISHPVSLNKDNSIPRLAWGKYFNEGEKIKMPFSVQVNHALIDGFQLGKFFELLQENIEKFELS
jgi:chloramphenicol O-acetyltransferase type A